MNEINELIPPCCLGKIKYLYYSEDPYPLRPTLKPPCFLFWETLYFIGLLIFCSGYHLKFGVLRVFPGQVSFTVIIECSKIMF